MQVDEFLASIGGIQAVYVETTRLHRPGEGVYNRRSRIDASPAPFREIVQVRRQMGYVGMSFRADEFGSMYISDQSYPRLAVYNLKTEERYLVLWPACDQDGAPIPPSSRYFDEAGNELDFDRNLASYWKLARKGRETGGSIRPTLVKFGAIKEIAPAPNRDPA